MTAPSLDADHPTHSKLLERDAARWRNLHITLRKEGDNIFKVDIDFGDGAAPVTVIREVNGDGGMGHCVHPRGIEEAILRSMNIPRPLA